jgi:hypothetical protein
MKKLAICMFLAIAISGVGGFAIGRDYSEESKWYGYGWNDERAHCRAPQ